ncbi:MAG TPA: hypothetical protein VN845_05475 [Solirubrobacteraceae bacterium]|nr:hypothetical protein [Solirubrobacteraceae bacterium]
MRPRALLFLLALTAGDYLLWQWSIAGGHDVVSLLAGCTLVPLGAVSAYRLVLAGASLLSWTARRTKARSRATAPAKQASPDVQATPQARRRTGTEADSSSGKLAA